MRGQTHVHVRIMTRHVLQMVVLGVKTRKTADAVQNVLGIKKRRTIPITVLKKVQKGSVQSVNLHAAVQSVLHTLAKVLTMRMVVITVIVLKSASRVQMMVQISVAMMVGLVRRKSRAAALSVVDLQTENHVANQALHAKH